MSTMPARSVREPVWTAARWAQMTAVFEHAVTLPRAEQQAWLLAVAAADPPLAHAAQRMLVADAGLEDAPPRIHDTLVEACDPVLPAGTQLGGYAIEASLGSGGMGRVYRARRGRQVVAIKCARFAAFDPQIARCLIRERDLLAGLDHPRLIHLLDAGVDTHGRPFLVLEYIAGLPLTAFAEARQLSLRARLRLLLAVMDAVAYLHAHGIVHRDLKPANILVDARGEPHLIDLGVAERIAGRAPSQASIDDPALDRGGSAGYASPAQLRGAPATIGDDLHALGIVCAELCRPLTGTGESRPPAVADRGP